jgi:FKBP-type peptidyl-prolyl cis-trans isomerase (trigger factor)
MSATSRLKKVSRSRSPRRSTRCQPFDPGDLSAIALQRPAVAIDDAAVDGALQRLRDRAARHEPVEGRGVDDGDTVVLDLERRDGKGAPDTHTDVSIELGAKANPPGFDAQLLGLEVGATKSFDIHYPQDYPIGELANTDVSYTVTIKGSSGAWYRNWTTSSPKTSATSTRWTR